MKGKNTIKLNNELMLEALQMWVDSAIVTKPKVVAVRIIAASTYPEPGTPGHFEVDLDG